MIANFAVLSRRNEHREAAACVESTKTAIATEATQTASLLQKLEVARNTYGSESVKAERAALDERMKSLLRDVDIANERFSKCRSIQLYNAVLCLALSFPSWPPVSQHRVGTISQRRFTSE